MTQNTNFSYTTHIIQTEDGELAVELSYDILAQMGWTQDTDLFWDVRPDGSVEIKEVK